jgi:hypothetical protein
MLCHWRSSAVERSEYLKDYSHVQVDKTKDQDENNFLWHSSTPMKATLQQELRLEAQNTLCQVLTLVTGIRKHLRQVLFLSNLIVDIPSTATCLSGHESVVS